jgi:hypothetical protein
LNVNLLDQSNNFFNFTDNKITNMDLFNEMPRFKSSQEFFSTDEDELVNMEFQTSDDQIYTNNNNEEVLNVKKKKSFKSESLTLLRKKSSFWL